MKNISEIYKVVIPVLTGLLLVVGFYFVYKNTVGSGGYSGTGRSKVIYVFDMKGFIDSERGRVLEGVFSGDSEVLKSRFKKRMKYLNEFLSSVDGIVFVKGAIVSVGGDYKVIDLTPQARDYIDRKMSEGGN